MERLREVLYPVRGTGMGLEREIYEAKGAEALVSSARNRNDVLEEIVDLVFNARTTTEVFEERFVKQK